MKANQDVSNRARHPLHPVMTHSPMALLMISSLWDLLGFWRGDSFWQQFSLWSIAVGLLFAIIALFTGIMDYAKIPQGGPAEAAGMRHLMIMVVAVMLYTGSFIIRYRTPIGDGYPPVIAIALSAAGLLLLLVGGWYGGELVYRYGVGIRDRPHQMQEERK